jgi:hypothetical protein
VNLNELRTTVLASNPVDDWQITRQEMSGLTIVYKYDVALRIEHDDEADALNENYVEDWANKHPDPMASSSRYRVYYGPSLVASVVLVCVDGGRASLPQPDLKTMEPNRFEFRIAEIVNFTDAHEYAERSGFKLPI